MPEIILHKTEIGYRLKNGNKSLLKNLNLKACKGELIALAGVNGSGKSTLLRSLAGLGKPLSGNILIGDKSPESYGKKEFARKVAFVSSEISGIRYLKVKDLVALGRFPHQNFIERNTEKDKKAVNSAMQITGILKLKDKYTDEISDGERQKAMTARALAQDTDIILLDEPASFLDTANKFALYEILSDACIYSGKTIIFSTHDLNIALKYSDKVWLIKNGNIYEGAPEDLIYNKIFDDIFPKGKIIFRPETGEFSVKFEKKHAVKIIDEANDGIKLRLLENALLRKGFYNSDEESDLIIRVYENGFSLVKGKNEYKGIANFYELLKIIY